MIIVTGTKRSGTSMWMQILIAAGFPAFGEPFPLRWGELLRDANPEGFHESLLCNGIYHATNPHPVSGEYFFPDQVRRHAVKVFVPGLRKTDVSFIGRVVATVRPWREYEASLMRLRAMEDAQGQLVRPDWHPPFRVPPALEWWTDNFLLLRDITTRCYPVHLQSYDGLLEDPEGVIRHTLRWIGEGDVRKALAAVKPQHRTQQNPASDSVDLRHAAVFDELYATIHAGKSLPAAFIEKLNETHRELQPLLQELSRCAAKEASAGRETLADGGGVGGDPDG